MITIIIVTVVSLIGKPPDGDWNYGALITFYLAEVMFGIMFVLNCILDGM